MEQPHPPSPTAQDESTPVSQRVVEKVAEATGTDPTDVSPMYPRVDPDSLDSLFDDTRFAEDATGGFVTFRMSGCRVLIWANGSVDVEVEDEVSAVSPADAPEPSPRPAVEPSD